MQAEADWDRDATLPGLQPVIDPRDHSGVKNELIHETHLRGLRLALRLVARRRYGTALDFGCGIGRLTPALLELADQVVGVDPSQGMLERACRDYGGATRQLRAARRAARLDRAGSRSIRLRPAAFGSRRRRLRPSRSADTLRLEFALRPHNRARAGAATRADIQLRDVSVSNSALRRGRHARRRADHPARVVASDTRQCFCEPWLPPGAQTIGLTLRRRRVRVGAKTAAASARTHAFLPTRKQARTTQLPRAYSAPLPAQASRMLHSGRARTHRRRLQG